MSIDGSLILNIALGIIVAKVLSNMLKEIELFLNRKIRRLLEVDNAGDTLVENDDDWLDLWESLPESAKDHAQKLVEDDQLRRHAKQLKLWSYLWAFAPEETKEKLRSRWKAAKTQSPKLATSK